MELQKAVYALFPALCPWHLSDIEAVGLHHFSPGHPVHVLVCFADRKLLAAHGAAAEKPASKTESFLICKYDDFQRMPQPPATLDERLAHFQACHAAEHPVILPAVRNRIQMGTGHDSRKIWMLSFQPDNQIAGLIHTGL